MTRYRYIYLFIIYYYFDLAAMGDIECAQDVILFLQSRNFHAHAMTDLINSLTYLFFSISKNDKYQMIY